MGKISEMAMEIARPIASLLNLEIVEVNYEKKFNGMHLTFFIARQDGSPVTIVDCETLHRAIDVPLDELNPTDDKPYTLNVSSLGLDRPLSSDRDFARNLNKKIEVRLYAPMAGGKKKLVGVLTSFDEVKFCIECEKGEKFEFERSKTAKIVPFIEF